MFTPDAFYQFFYTTQAKEIEIAFGDEYDMMYDPFDPRKYRIMFPGQAPPLLHTEKLVMNGIGGMLESSRKYLDIAFFGMIR